MNRVIYWTLMCLLTILCVACNEEQEVMNDEEQENFDLPTEYVFVYKGIEYSSPCKIIDRILFVEDDEARSVLEELRKNPNTAQYITEDYKNLFFDSLDELYQSINYENESILTRSLPYKRILEVELWLHENTDNKKCFDYFMMTENSPIIQQPQMKKGYSNKLSSFSLKIWSSSGGGIQIPGLPYGYYSRLVFEIYDGDNFQGFPIALFNRGPYEYLEIYEEKNLKKVYDVNGRSVNDRASSFKLYLTKHF